MNIYEFLALPGLKDIKQTGQGKYLCKCPAHNDDKASLSIGEGEKGIVLTCFAKCKTEDICEKLGIKMSDLFYKEKKEAPKQKSRGKVVAVYPYHDEKGRLLFEVLRYEPKSFCQRMPDVNNPGRYIYKSSPVQVLYHLPDVIKAINAGETVYLVEGEKDADNMRRLGYCATTIAMGAGKWKQVHTDELKGGHVVLIPDNDKPGQEYMSNVFTALCTVCKSVRIANLQEVWVDMPEKADVSDLIAKFGDEEGKKLIDRAVERAAISITSRPINTPAEDEAKRESVNDDTEAGRAYANVDGYCVHDGWLCQFNADGGLKRLASFAAIPRKEKSKDDGLSVQKGYEIEGFNVGGQSMGTAWVTAKEFPGMNWAIEKWGFRANIMPGNTNKDKIRYAIQACGEKGLVKETIYTHTGWRKIDNKWVYLHSGGAIGAEDIGVQLEGKLESYDMELDKEIDIYDAIEAEKGYFNAMEASIAYPLLAVAYMSPLCEFMNAADIMPKFALYLRGGTQTRKTTAALLTLSHFGHFGSQNKIPASFSDTANSVQRSAFILKDMPLLVDDYYPNGNGQERKRMEAMAQALARAFGNGTTRSRLNSDMALRAGQSPRGMAIFTGEDLPDIKESGLARYFIVNVQRGDIPIGEMLTELQTKARQGYLTRAMSRYIEWLIPQADELPEKLYERYMSYRESVLEKLTAAGARAAETLASMLLSLEMMLEFWKSLGSIEKEDAQGYMTEAWNVLSATAIMQGRENREQKPTVIFLSILSELLGSGEYRCLSLDDDKGPLNVLGYADAEYYYMYPEKSYRAVTKFLADQGSGFPVTLQTLRKMMVEEKVINPGDANKVKKVKGKSQRFMWLPRPLIDGREEKPSQTEMTETDEEAPF